MFCSWDFYRRLTVRSSKSSNYRHVASMFLKFGEVIVEYFAYKRVFSSPPISCYYLSMKLFLFQPKMKNTVKAINQNFRSNKLNEKKIPTTFYKKTNLWICDALSGFFSFVLLIIETDLNLLGLQRAKSPQCVPCFIHLLYEKQQLERLLLQFSFLHPNPL